MIPHCLHKGTEQHHGHQAADHHHSQEEYPVIVIVKVRHMIINCIDFERILAYTSKSEKSFSLYLLNITRVIRVPMVGWELPILLIG